MMQMIDQADALNAVKPALKLQLQTILDQILAEDEAYQATLTQIAELDQACQHAGLERNHLSDSLAFAEGEKEQRKIYQQMIDCHMRQEVAQSRIRAIQHADDDAQHAACLRRLVVEEEQRAELQDAADRQKIDQDRALALLDRVAYSQIAVEGIARKIEESRLVTNRAQVKQQFCERLRQLIAFRWGHQP